MTLLIIVGIIATLAAVTAICEEIARYIANDEQKYNPNNTQEDEEETDYDFDD